MKFTITFFVFLSLTFNASAYATTILSIMQDKRYGTILFIDLSTPAEKVPCHTNTKWSYVLDTSTLVGQQKLSLLIAAKLNKTDVKITGTGQCDVFSGIEELSRIEF